MIDHDLARFLEEGLGIHVGTRTPRLEPNGVRATAVEVHADGVHLAVFVQEAAAARVLPDLHANGAAAVVFCRPSDDRTCQVNGLFVEARAARDDEQAWVLGQWGRFLAQLERIGIPPTASAGWVTWPSTVLRLKATAIFDGTPGPNAGHRLA